MDTFNALEMFIQTVDKGSFSAVARSAAVSVSTVTLAIQQLEKQVGGALFHRTTRQIVLTELGQHFLSDAQRIVKDWHNSLAHLNSGNLLMGEIRMTAPNHLGRKRLPQLIDQFIEVHPHIEIQLLLSDHVEDMLKQHIDVALRTGPLTDSQMKARLLLQGRRMVCAAPSYWQQYGKPAHPQDLLQHNCLFLNDFNVKRNNWKFQQQQEVFTVKVQGNRSANDGHVLYEWAAAGQGATLQMEWDIAEDIQAGKIETVLDEYALASHDLFAVYHAQASLKVKAWVDFLVAHLNAEHI